jgi:hypothetical protein
VYVDAGGTVKIKFEQSSNVTSNNTEFWDVLCYAISLKVYNCERGLIDVAMTVKSIVIGSKMKIVVSNVPVLSSTKL